MPRRSDLIPIDKDALVEMYWGKRMTLTEIAEELGVHFMTGHRRMVEYGIPRRNMGSRRADGDHPLHPAVVLTPRFLTNTYIRKQMSTDQIAAQTGFNPTTVSYYLRQARIPVRGTGFSRQHHIEKKELVKLRRQRLSNREIAKRYGCSMTTLEGRCGSTGWSEPDNG